MQQVATVSSTGASVTYDNGVFVVGAETVGIEKVMEYDRLGALTWVSEETKVWAQQVAASALGAPRPVAVAQPVAVPAMPQPAAPTAGATKPKKPLYKKWWVWVLGILLLGAVGNAIGGGSPETAPSTNAAAPAVTASSAPAATTPEAPVPEAAAPAAPSTPVWTAVTKLSGSSNKRGGSFHLTGNDARLTYKITGKSSLICGIYVMDKGTSLKESGGFPEVMVTKAGSDSTVLSQGEGDYYLDVTAANCSWSVTIEEMK